MTTLDPRFLRICDITQRILIGYLNVDEQPKLFKSYMNKIEKDDIMSGMTLCILRDDYNNWEDRVVKIYDFTVDVPTHPYYLSSTDPIYVEFVIMDGMDDFGTQVYYPTPSRMTIIFPKRLMDISEDSDTKSIIYGYTEYICGLYDCFEQSRMNPYDRTNTNSTYDIRYMREMLVVFAFLKSTFNGDAESFMKMLDGEFDASDVAAAKMIDSYDNIAWTDNGPEANITKVIEDFDGADVAYWDRLTDYLIEAQDNIDERLKNEGESQADPIDRYLHRQRNKNKL